MAKLIDLTNVTGVKRWFTNGLGLEKASPEEASESQANSKTAALDVPESAGKTERRA